MAELFIENIENKIIQWKWDFESEQKVFLDTIRELDYEKVFLLTCFIDGSYKFEEIWTGSNGEVRFETNKLKVKKWISNLTLYHNHPGFSTPPSSDDLSQVLHWDKNIQHKIITQDGIWEFSLIDQNKASDISHKLWSIFLYLTGIKDKIDFQLKLVTLQKISPIYKDLALAYNDLMNENISFEQKEIAQELFQKSMKEVWFRIWFTKKRA